ncbi:hypothetical protein ABW19_dt0201269 [Dactylella cylindrospora]|nr:hypothetical protein ABW19_dt0201269 [Dactylella cylindrospora]
MGYVDPSSKPKGNLSEQPPELPARTTTNGEREGRAPNGQPPPAEDLEEIHPRSRSRTPSRRRDEGSGDPPKPPDADVSKDGEEANRSEDKTTGDPQGTPEVPETQLTSKNEEAGSNSRGLPIPGSYLEVGGKPRVNDNHELPPTPPTNPSIYSEIGSGFIGPEVSPELRAEYDHIAKYKRETERNPSADDFNRQTPPQWQQAPPVSFPSLNPYQQPNTFQGETRDGYPVQPRNSQPKPQGNMLSRGIRTMANNLLYYGMEEDEYAYQQMQREQERKKELERKAKKEARQRIEENERLKKRVGELERENRDLSDRCVKYRKRELEQQKEIYELTQKQTETANRYLNHMNDIQTNIDSYTQLLAPERDDSYWKPKFSNMRNRVQTWAITVVPQLPKELRRARDTKITSGYEQEFFQVIPMGEGTIDDILASIKGAKKRRFFLQGWINLTLCKFVFASSIPAKCGLEHIRSTGQDLWLSHASSEALLSLEYDVGRSGSRISPDQKAFHKWRTLTISLLRKVYGEDKMSSDFQESVKKRCREMAEILVELGGGNPEMELEQIEANLYEIFEEAVSLSAEFRSQRAAFEFRFPVSWPTSLARPLQTDEPPPVRNPYVVRFDPAWMEADRDERELVDFVIEPAIFKAGNGQGERYEEGSWFLKASVACFKPSSEKMLGRPLPPTPSPNMDGWVNIDRSQDGSGSRRAHEFQDRMVS